MLALTLTLACTGQDDCAAGYGRTNDGNCVAFETGDDPVADDTGPVGLDTDPPDTSDAGQDTDTFDPGEEIEGVCEAPETLPDDPITIDFTWSGAKGGHFVEWTEIALKPNGEYVYTVGHGGLYGFEVRQDGLGDPRQTRASYGEHGRFHEVVTIDDDRLVASSRDGGWSRFDIAASNMDLVGGRSVDGAGSLASDGTYLWLGTFEGSLYTYDLSTEEAEELSRTHDVLSSPWGAEVHDDRLYVADNSLGIVVFDLTNPADPVLVDSIEVQGSAQDLVVGDGVIYVAAGSGGIEVFELSDPDSPVSVGVYDYGTALVNLALEDEVLYAVSHEDLVAYDVSTPTSPTVLGAEKTEQYALAVVANGDEVLIADWGNIPQYTVDADVRSPEADPSRSRLYFYDGSRTATVEVANRGADVLEILGATTDDDRFTIKATSTTVPPGESITVTVVFDDDGAEVDAELCLATNDPDEPLMSLALSESEAVDASLSIGEEAPDFTLADVDGNSHRLSEQLGHPVLLVYFATW